MQYRSFRVLSFLLLGSVLHAPAFAADSALAPYKTCPNPKVVESDLRYDWAEIPTSANAKDREAYLILRNGLNPYFAGEFDAPNLPTPLANDDFAKDPCKHLLNDAPNVPYPAIRDVTGSHPADALVWVEGGDLRPIPDMAAKPIARTKQMHLMRMTRTYGTDWKFVWDRNVFGWTKREATPIAADDTPIPHSQEATTPLTFTERQNAQAIDATIDRLEHMDKKSAAYKEEAARVCPTDFSPREIDGLVPSEDTDSINSWNSARRVRFHLACDPDYVPYTGGNGPVPDEPKLKHVTFTAHNCMCTSTFEGEADPVEVHAFPPQDKAGHFDCTALKQHVLCEKPGRAAEGGSTYIACPLHCVSAH